MPNRIITTAQRSQVHYIAVAADLAAAMIRELECLQSDNGPLALLMGTAGSSAQQQLLSLLRIIEWLKLTRNAEEVAHLIAHAKALLLRLANELEQLSSAAGCDFNPRRRHGIGLGFPRSLFHFEATNEPAVRPSTPKRILSTRAPPMHSVHTHGAQIPALGFGTYGMSNAELLKIIPAALKAGLKTVGGPGAR